MASQLLPRPVHGAVYKWTPDKHFLRLQESLKKNKKKKQSKTKPALKEDHLNNPFSTSPCALGIHMFSPRPSCGPFALEDPDLRPGQRPSNREAKWSRFKLAEVCINTSSSRFRKRLPRTFKNNSLQFNNSIQLNGVLSLFPLSWHAQTCTHNANSNWTMGFTKFEVHKMLRGYLQSVQKTSPSMGGIIPPLSLIIHLNHKVESPPMHLNIAPTYPNSIVQKKHLW